MGDEGPNEARVGVAIGDVPNMDSYVGNAGNKFATGGKTATTENLTRGTKDADYCPGIGVPDRGGGQLAAHNEPRAIHGESEAVAKHLSPDFLQLTSHCWILPGEDTDMRDPGIVGKKQTARGSEEIFVIQRPFPVRTPHKRISPLRDPEAIVRSSGEMEMMEA